MKPEFYKGVDLKELTDNFTEELFKQINKEK